MANDDLSNYRSRQTEPADFAEFWSGTLTQARQHPQQVELVEVPTGLLAVDVFDMTFSGFGGHPIRGWLRMPKEREHPVPAIVQFHGYSSGRGAPLDDLLLASLGYAHLIMDVRGQGVGAAEGATGDPVGSGPSRAGFMTRGIEDPSTYFYRRVFADAVRAVEALRTLEVVDPHRVAVIGASQGGGIALAVAGLVADLSAVLIQAPLLCDFPAALTAAAQGPYLEIRAYLKARRASRDAVFDTLSYFDGVNFARRAHAPAWFSTGLLDTTCPPATAYAAHSAYAGSKKIRAWEFNDHDAGGSHDVAAGVRILEQMLSPAAPTVREEQIMSSLES
jgi:cephalosporin-C deacetylase